MRPELNLYYVVREPRTGQETNPPVLILLHGFSMYENHLFEMAQGFDPRLAIISVRAPLRIGPGAYRWFYFDRTPEGPIVNDDEEEQSRQALNGFVDGLIAQLAPRRVYLLGHSQGGTMALTVALTRPRQIDGCINVNGRILRKIESAICSPEALVGLPFFDGHGVENDIVPISLARATRDRLAGLQVSLSYHEYPIGHEITADVMAQASDWLTALMNNTG